MLFLAAGDDSSAFLPPDLVPAYHQTCNALMKPDKEGVYGLGQCSAEIINADYDDIMFCSKWSFSHSNDLSTLTFTRDY